MKKSPRVSVAAAKTLGSLHNPQFVLMLRKLEVTLTERNTSETPEQLRADKTSYWIFYLILDYIVMAPGDRGSRPARHSQTESSFTLFSLVKADI